MNTDTLSTAVSSPTAASLALASAVAGAASSPPAPPAPPADPAFPPPDADAPIMLAMLEQAGGDSDHRGLIVDVARCPRIAHALAASGLGGASLDGQRRLVVLHRHAMGDLFDLLMPKANPAFSRAMREPLAPGRFRFMSLLSGRATVADGQIDEFRASAGPALASPEVAA